MRGTIHQAYFLPWLGYFSKLAYSDTFVALDDVQFRKRHYYDRTKIVNMQGEVSWLSLPVGENFKRKCCDVFINSENSQFKAKVLRTLRESYSKGRQFDSCWPQMESLLSRTFSSSVSLFKINLTIIVGILEFLEIPVPQITLSSEIEGNFNDPTQRIIEICRFKQLSALTIGGGMSQIVHDLDRLKNEGIEVFIQDYLAFHPIYEQTRRKVSGFQSGLSIIDSILNVGKDKTRDFLIGSETIPKKLI